MVARAARSLSGDCLHGCGGGFSGGDAGEDSGVGGSERARVVDAVHLRAAEVYSAVLERVAFGLDGLERRAARTKRLKDEETKRLRGGETRFSHSRVCETAEGKLRKMDEDKVRAA